MQHHLMHGFKVVHEATRRDAVQIGPHHVRQLLGLTETRAMFRERGLFQKSNTDWTDKLFFKLSFRAEVVCIGTYKTQKVKILVQVVLEG